MGARRARPRPGHPRPRPRPLPTSPPLPQGWGRPLPGPRGRPGFRAEGLTDPQSAVEREKHVLLKSGRQRGVCGGRAGEEGSPGGGGAQVVGGRRQVPGESCGGEKGEGQQSPPAISSHPSSPSPAPLPQPSSSCRTWLGSIAPGVSTACGWTDLKGNTESSGVRRGTPAPAEGGATGELPDLRCRIKSLPPQAQRGPGKGFLEPAFTPKHPVSPRLTADGAAESSLLFIRFPGPGKGEAEGRGDEKREADAPRNLPVQPSFHRPRY